MSVADLGARPQLAPLLAELAGARRRASGLALAGAASIALAAGLGAFCALQIGFALVGHEWEWLGLSGLDGIWPASAMPAPVGAHALAAAVVAVVIFLAALLGELRGRPGVSLLARRADRTFALEERVSTALEVAARPDRERGSLEAALLLDVAERSAAVGRRGLVPFRLPGAAIVAAGLLLLAVALVAFGVTTQPPAAPSTMAQPAIGAAERAELAEDVRRIAALMAADAEERADPYIAAIARELDTTAETIAADPALDRTAIADELRRLLPYAEAAYAGAGVAAGAPQNLAGLIEAAARGVEARAQAAPAPMTGGLPPNAAAPAAPGNAVAGGGPTDATQPTLEAMLEALERPAAGPRPTVQGPLGAAPAGAVAADEEPYFNPLQMQGGTPPMGAEGNQPGQFIGGAPAGAAADAGLAEGDAVGGGARPLEDGVVTQFGALPTPTEEMVLGDPRTGDGRRIRLDAPATADGTVLAAGERTDGAGWQRLPEAEVTRTLLPPALLDVLSRYFKPAAEAAE